MIHHPALTPVIARYADAEPDMQPISVTVHMVPGARVIHYNPPTLCGLLSWCVVTEATAGAMLPRDNAAPYAMPVPILPLWREHESGAPLLAVTPLSPVGDHVWDRSTETKRPQEGRFTRTRTGRFTVTPSTGRWRARQIHRPALVTLRMEATCIGLRAEIERLLASAVALGKRRASGHGQVASWEIADADEWVITRGGRLMRSVPQGARDLIPGTPAGEPALGAWSPPAWQRALYRPVWAAGTEVTV